MKKKFKEIKITKKLVRKLSKLWTRHLKAFPEANSKYIARTLQNKTIGSFIPARRGINNIYFDRISKMEFILYCAAVYRGIRKQENERSQ